MRSYVDNNVRTGLGDPAIFFELVCYLFWLAVADGR
jgi:hypothetical protein